MVVPFIVLSRRGLRMFSSMQSSIFQIIICVSNFSNFLQELIAA